MTHHDHDVDDVGIALVTISSSRTLDDDDAGDCIVEAIAGEDGVTLSDRRLVADIAEEIGTVLDDLLHEPAVDAIVTTGGTGITPDDRTIDVAKQLFDTELPGFGEAFRRRSAEEVGTRGIATRATAGVVEGVVVFCLPGSENAARLGIEQLILPEVSHLVAMATRSLNRSKEVGIRDESERTTRQPGDRRPKSEDFTHVDEDGNAEMVDVGEKPASKRRAVAAGRIEVTEATVTAIQENKTEKGDVLATARVGAIQAVKHTWETIPLCHQIPITNVETAFTVEADAVNLSVAVETIGQTGCEMEALQGVTTGLNVIWDMIKAIEKDEDGEYPETAIRDVRVVEKSVEGRTAGGEESSRSSS